MPFIGDQATANAKIKKHVFTASGSQTEFTVSSNASDELQVFLNGVLLKLTDDYTYTTSTVTLGSGATASDIVEVHVYQSFVVADAVKVSGDTMTGELEVPTVKLSSNVIKASDGGSSITLDTSDNVTVGGNLQVGGNIIKASDGGSTITLDTSDNVTVAGDLTVTGGDIKSSGGTTAISVSGANVTLAGTANNVGTVTAGTFNSTLGSDVVFPAGHIITLEQYVRGPTIQNSTTSYVTCLEDSITVKSATSKILIMIQATVGTQTAGDNRAVLKIIEDSGNGDGLGSATTSTDDYVFCTMGSQSSVSGTGQQSDVGFYYLHDHNADAGDTLDYKVQFRSDTSSEYVYFNNYGFSPDGTEKSSMVLMEVAQ